jgi:hypothetical protein
MFIIRIQRKNKPYTQNEFSLNGNRWVLHVSVDKSFSKRYFFTINFPLWDGANVKIISQNKKKFRLRIIKALIESVKKSSSRNYLKFLYPQVS